MNLIWLKLSKKVECTIFEEKLKEFKIEHEKYMPAIEHSPEQETGLVLLALSAQGAQVLNQHLIAAGWRVHPPRSEK